MKNLLTKKKIGSKLTVVMLLSLAFTNYVSASYEIESMNSGDEPKFNTLIKNIQYDKHSSFKKELEDNSLIDLNGKFKVAIKDSDFNDDTSGSDIYQPNPTTKTVPFTLADLAIYYKNPDALKELVARGASLDSVFENEKYFNNDDRAELYNYLRPIKDAQKAVLKYSEAKQSRQFNSETRHLA